MNTDDLLLQPYTDTDLPPGGKSTEKERVITTRVKKEKFDL